MVDTPAQAGFIFEVLGAEGGKAELVGNINQFLAAVAGGLEAELAGGQLGEQGLDDALTAHVADFLAAVSADPMAQQFTEKVLDLYTLLIEGKTTVQAVSDSVERAKQDLILSRFPDEVVGA